MGFRLKNAACVVQVTDAGPYDLVVVDSVIERMTQPLSLLRALPSLVRPQACPPPVRRSFGIVCAAALLFR